MRDVNLNSRDFATLYRNTAQKGGCFRFKAHGSSMHPFIHDGDVLTVQPTDVDALRRGDAILYSVDQDRFIVHRIVGRENRTGQTVLKTRGDAFTGFPESVEPEQVMGRVVIVQRGTRIVYENRGFRRLATLLWSRVSKLRSLLLIANSMMKWNVKPGADT